MAAMVRCIWQVVHLPHSGASLVQLWSISGALLVQVWCISGASLVQLWCISGTSLVQLRCISDASLVLLSHSNDHKQFFLLALCSFAAPSSLQSGVLRSITFSSSSFAKTLLPLSAMILVDSSSCTGRQAAGKWQVRRCLSHQLSRRRSQSILGFLTGQEPPD